MRFVNRICHCEGEEGAPLLAPCYCSGSLRYVHQACLQQWIKASDTRACELCKFTFIMHAKTKPFCEVGKLRCGKISPENEKYHDSVVLQLQLPNINEM